MEEEHMMTNEMRRLMWEHTDISVSIRLNCKMPCSNNNNQLVDGVR